MTPIRSEKRREAVAVGLNDQVAAGRKEALNACCVPRNTACWRADLNIVASSSIENTASGVTDPWVSRTCFSLRT
jgi:hypothetical protein